jgi:hypothetical protein
VLLGLHAEFLDLTYEETYSTEAKAKPKCQEQIEGGLRTRLC